MSSKYINYLLVPVDEKSSLDKDYSQSKEASCSAFLAATKSLAIPYSGWGVTMKRTALVVTAGATLVLASLVTSLVAQNPPRPVLKITVSDLTTGQLIAPEQTVTAGDTFQVTASTGGTDCAGQFVVTALGASGAPPSVLVQFLPYIVGASVGSNSVTGGTLTASVLAIGTNDWKISTSCNAAATHQFAFSSFEFFAKEP
jgi:hypothetical protein